VVHKLTNVIGTEYANWEDELAWIERSRASPYQHHLRLKLSKINE
jgi:hypothetical protein